MRNLQNKCCVTLACLFHSIRMNPFMGVMLLMNKNHRNQVLSEELGYYDMLYPHYNSKSIIPTGDNWANWLINVGDAKNFITWYLSLDPDQMDRMNRMHENVLKAINDSKSFGKDIFKKENIEYLQQNVRKRMSIVANVQNIKESFDKNSYIIVLTTIRPVSNLKIVMGNCMYLVINNDVFEEHQNIFQIGKSIRFNGTIVYRPSKMYTYYTFDDLTDLTEITWK